MEFSLWPQKFLNFRRKRTFFEAPFVFMLMNDLEGGKYCTVYNVHTAKDVPYCICNNGTVSRR